MGDTNAAVLTAGSAEGKGIGMRVRGSTQGYGEPVRPAPHLRQRRVPAEEPPQVVGSLSDERDPDRAWTEMYGMQQAH